jgi:hypothetical protein
MMSDRLQLHGLQGTLPPIVLMVWEDPAPVDGAVCVRVIAVVGVVSLFLTIEALPPQRAVVILVVHPVPIAPATIK